MENNSERPLALQLQVPGKPLCPRLGLLLAPLGPRPAASDVLTALLLQS